MVLQQTDPDSPCDVRILPKFGIVSNRLVSPFTGSPASSDKMIIHLYPEINFAISLQKTIGILLKTGGVSLQVHAAEVAIVFFF
jgi:hypothetical protein